MADEPASSEHARCSTGALCKTGSIKMVLNEPKVDKCIGSQGSRIFKTIGITSFIVLCYPFKNILFMILKLKSGFVFV